MADMILFVMQKGNCFGIIFIRSCLCLVFIFLMFGWSFSTFVSTITICTSWLSISIGMILFLLLLVWFILLIFVVLILTLLAITFTLVASALWWIIRSADPFIWILTKFLSHIQSLYSKPDLNQTQTINLTQGRFEQMESRMDRMEKLMINLIEKIDQSGKAGNVWFLNPDGFIIQDNLTGWLQWCTMM